jgi:hypothetical protein
MFDEGYNRDGTILVPFVIMFTILASVVLGIVFYTLESRVAVERAYNKAVAENIAEAGIEKAIWEIKQGNSSYDGETESDDLMGLSLMFRLMKPEQTLSTYGDSLYS